MIPNKTINDTPYVSVSVRVMIEEDGESDYAEQIHIEGSGNDAEECDWWKCTRFVW